MYCMVYHCFEHVTRSNCIYSCMFFGLALEVKIFNALHFSFLLSLVGSTGHITGLTETTS